MFRRQPGCGGVWTAAVTICALLVDALMAFARTGVVADDTWNPFADKDRRAAERAGGLRREQQFDRQGADLACPAMERTIAVRTLRRCGPKICHGMAGRRSPIPRHRRTMAMETPISPTARRLIARFAARGQSRPGGGAYALRCARYICFIAVPGTGPLRRRATNCRTWTTYAGYFGERRSARGHVAGTRCVGRRAIAEPVRYRQHRLRSTMFSTIIGERVGDPQCSTPCWSSRC